ncbi:helix-turn-helix domain-containing protein [Spongiimicrobium salis]|uniref:helix-turn-helix domain-containing protein n=1 Tax=Spongiimicrobium salis TaxID=1667022 RepID=UPI00374DD074
MDLVVDFFLVSGIVVISIILFQLFRIQNKELPQNILMVLFFLLFSVAVYFYALLHNIIGLARFFFLPNDIATTVLGPLIFLYIQSLFLEEKQLLKRHILHFMPAFLFALCISLPTLIYGIFKIEALAYTHSNFIRTLIKAESLYFIGYLMISLRWLAKYRRWTKYAYSNLTKFDFHWVKVMLLSALGIMSIDFGFKLFEYFAGDFSWNADFISVLAMIVLVMYLGYYGVNQSKVLLPSFVVQLEAKPKIGTENKIISTAKREEFKTLKNKLELLLNTDQPYLDEELTLGKLARQIATTDKTLSILLNQYMNTTFYDLINKYRVEAVKEKISLMHYKNYNLFGIACECGFKSRTSFNRTFKKETGLSPSEYKKSIL